MNRVKFNLNNKQLQKTNKCISASDVQKEEFVCLDEYWTCNSGCINNNSCVLINVYIFL